MFSTSNDVLNLVLAICIIFLTFFLCWAIYYFIASIQKIHRVVKKVETGVAKIDEIIEIAREKLKNSSAYFMILGEIAKKAMEFVQEKRAQKKTGKTAKKK